MIRVLIAEDEPPIQRSIRATIEKLSDEFQVAGVAGDGEQALKMLEEQPYDVLFTDIRMPVMSGLQLMEEARQKYPEIMLVVISGYGTFEYSAHALRAHALDYLLKPVSEKDMTALLARLKQLHMQKRRQRLSRELAAGINRAPEGAVSGADQGEQVLTALFQADPQYWSQVNLELVVEELLGTMHLFTWVFMGDTAAERVLLLEERTGMLALIEYVYDYIRQQAPTPIRCACLKGAVALGDTRAALKTLSEALGREAPDKSVFVALDGVKGQDAHPLVERVRAYLEANFDQHITNQTLSDKFGYVPSYISLLFRKHLDVSPADYLNGIRLEKAKQLMRDEPAMMVKEIAEMVGFKNQYHFSKAFKKHTGLWPTSYRDGE